MEGSGGISNVGSYHQLRTGATVLGKGKCKRQGASSLPSWPDQDSLIENKGHRGAGAAL